MSDEREAIVQVLTSVDEIDATAWDANANPDPAIANPFVTHAFLHALEEAQAVRPETGWQPQHLVLTNAAGEIDGCMPLYAKSHSKGEYIFDYGWADAYESAGGNYYPKLLTAVPFTPVPGPRLLAHAGPNRTERIEMLMAGAIELARRHQVSSWHINFLTQDQWETAATLGCLQRTDQQFHWRNDGYQTFDDFLATLTSRKRKLIRRERREATTNGVTIELVTGSDIKEIHWDALYAFYMDTGSRKWGRPYLNRAFFSCLGAAMPDHCLLILARRDGEYVAGALNMIGGDCLYGRYWGCTEHHPCLHFEICYYQAIEYAIANGIDRVEAGAQGEHKLARGYMPTTTYSAHWIAEPGFRRALARYLDDERAYMENARESLASYGPYRKDMLAGCAQRNQSNPVETDND